jgi:hypothetical protein
MITRKEAVVRHKVPHRRRPLHPGHTVHVHLILEIKAKHIRAPLNSARALLISPVAVEPEDSCGSRHVSMDGSD